MHGYFIKAITNAAHWQSAIRAIMRIIIIMYIANYVRTGYTQLALVDHCERSTSRECIDSHIYYL